MPEAYERTGDWPVGGCWTKDSSCSKLGIKDNLCGRCEPLCEHCDAAVGFKLVADKGLRFGQYTFDAEKIAAGNYQPRNLCALARYVCMYVYIYIYIYIYI